MDDLSLSWWDRLKIAIMPKSYAEQTVDDIFGAEGRGLIPVPPSYDPSVASQPAIYVAAKQEIVTAVTNAASAVQNSAIKFGIIALVVIAALVALNAFIRK